MASSLTTEARALEANEPVPCATDAPEGATVNCAPAQTPDGKQTQLCTVTEPSGATFRCLVEPGLVAPVPLTVPLLRLRWANLMLGMGSVRALNDAERPGGFSLQVLASLMLEGGRQRMFGIRPELGYAQEQLGDEKARLFVAGVGPYWAPTGDPMLELRYAPRFVVGGAGGTALGVRHGLAAHLVYGVLGVELSHQALWVGGKAQHDGRLLVTFDPGLVLYGLVFGTGVLIFGMPH